MDYKDETHVKKASLQEVGLSYLHQRDSDLPRRRRSCSWRWIFPWVRRAASRNLKRRCLGTESGPSSLEDEPETDPLLFPVSLPPSPSPSLCSLPLDGTDSQSSTARVLLFPSSSVLRLSPDPWRKHTSPSVFVPFSSCCILLCRPACCFNYCQSTPNEWSLACSFKYI